MLNRALSGAFAWQSNAVESKRERAALQKGLMRLMNGKLAAALSTWKQAAAQWWQATWQSPLEGGWEAIQPVAPPIL